MRLEQVYNGRQFPAYCYDHCVMMLGISPEYCPKEDQKPEYLYLPASTRQIERALLRAGIDRASGSRIWIEIDELPEKVTETLDLEWLSRDDLPDLNLLCRAIAPMKDADLKKLNAVVLTAEPGDIMAVCQLAENLDQFDFIGEDHIRAEAGQFNAYGYVAYHGTLTLDELMRADPADQHRQEVGQQMM